MRRHMGISILLFLLLIFGSSSYASPQISASTNDDSYIAQSRLVVFEAFMRAT